MQYKFSEENLSFIKEAITSGDLQPYLQTISTTIENKENDLLKSVSKNYLKIIQHCQELHKIKLPQEIQRNLPKLKEVGSKIIYSSQSERENKFCLERVQLLIKDINELLKIISYLNQESNLKEEVLLLESVKEKIIKFYKFNFFTVLENEIKQKTVILNKRVREETADWIVFLRRNTDLIINNISFKKSQSLIFKEFYEVRKMFDMERMTDLLFVCKKMNISTNFIYEYLQNYENENELVVFALALIFLSEVSEIDRFINFSKINDLDKLRKLKDLYNFVEEDTSLLEIKQKELSNEILERNKPLLEEDINQFLRKVKIDYNREMAEFIDTFICNKFMEGKKVDVSQLVKDDRFIDYEWNWQIMLNKERNKMINEQSNELKEKINQIFSEDKPFIERIILLLNEYDKSVINDNESYLFDKYSLVLRKDKDLNELRGEIVVLAKYLKERKCNNEKIKELIK